MPRSVSSSIAATRAWASPSFAAIARPIVIAEHPVGPAAGGQRCLIFARCIAASSGASHGASISWKLNGRCTPGRIGAIIGHQPLDRQVDLPDQQPIAIVVRERPHFGGDLVHLGLVGRMELEHLVHLAHAGLIVPG